MQNICEKPEKARQVYSGYIKKFIIWTLFFLINQIVTEFEGNFTFNIAHRSVHQVTYFAHVLINQFSVGYIATLGDNAGGFYRSDSTVSGAFNGYSPVTLFFQILQYFARHLSVGV